MQQGMNFYLLQGINDMDKYRVVQFRYVTEKAKVLERLQDSSANASLKKCSKSKYVFVVDVKADKRSIAKAIEAIYVEKKIRVVDVNTIKQKPKKRRVRGRQGMTKAFKKAIVTLESGDVLEEV
jgi:large subunit ribosomal protein L23